MSTGRIFRALLATAPTGSKGRIYRAQMPGSAAVTPKGRIYRAQVLGSAAVSVVAPSSRTAGPGEPVHLVASLAGGGAADLWTWRVISGPAFTLVGTGAVRDFSAPSVMPPGGSIVLGITATVSGTRSPEVTCTITVLPQLSWSYNGTAWVGRRTVYA